MSSSSKHANKYTPWQRKQNQQYTQGKQAIAEVRRQRVKRLARRNKMETTLVLS